jgi:STE24 endopeptidase
MNPYFIAILIILVGGSLFRILVEALNLSKIDAKLPQEFETFYEAESYEKSQSYLKENTRFGLVKTILSTGVLLAFLLLGGFQWIDEMARSLTDHSLLQGLAFVGILLILSQLSSLPFSIYETFVIEERYGFNRTTPKTFGSDLLKGLILALVIGAPILAALFWFFETVGPAGWLWAWIALIAFQGVMLLIGPSLIMPLFNKYSPLPEGELKNEIESFAQSQNFELKGIYTMDGSKRSSKANAFFTGFGKSKRIVLFDTLIDKHTIEELVAVLAHEIGHYKEKHIFRQVTLSFVSTGVMLFIFSLFLENPSLFEAFRVEQTSVYASFVFFGILYSPLARLTSLFSLHLSRKYEFEADEYAAQTYGKPDQLATALKKLSVDNLSNLKPHPLKVFLDYTHPPVLERVENLKKSF